jgi:hypothetical protein
MPQRLSRYDVKRSDIVMRPCVVGLAPWQFERLREVSDRLGISDDDIVQAGLTLILSTLFAMPGLAMEALADAHRVRGQEKGGE